MDAIICDFCKRAVARGARRAATISATLKPIYIKGEIALWIDGQGAPADLCDDCIRKVLGSSEIVDGGPIIKNDNVAATKYSD